MGGGIILHWLNPHGSDQGMIALSDGHPAIERIRLCIQKGTGGEVREVNAEEFAKWQKWRPQSEAQVGPTKRIAFMAHHPFIWGHMRHLAEALSEADVRCFCPQAFGDAVVENWTGLEFEKYQEFDPDTTIFWNGYLGSVWPAFDHLRGRRRCLVMENGWLPQAGHLSLLPDAACLVIPQYPWVPGREAGHVAMLDKIRASYGITHIPGIDIFVPLQLELDTQITVHGHIFRTMNAMLTWLHQTFPRRSISFTEHPKSKTHLERPGTRLHSRSIDLAVSAAMVAGVNSTVLAEACLFRRPIIGFGRHVCEGLFLNQSRKIEPVDPWPEYAAECDYRSAMLALNQFPTFCPSAQAVALALGKTNTIALP